MQTIVDQSNDPDKEAYLEAYRLLETSVFLYTSSAQDRGILSWPLEISAAILPPLERKTTMALILLLHYGVVLHLLRGMWFARHAGRRLVLSLLPHLAGAGEEWEGIIYWGRRSVGIP